MSPPGNAKPSPASPQQSKPNDEQSDSSESYDIDLLYNPAGQMCVGQKSQLAVQLTQFGLYKDEADRQVGLLEKLESRQKSAWQVLFDKELEELAADSYMSRYHRQSRLDSR